MTTADNKVKFQLRPSFSGTVSGSLSRPDKNPSPSKLMINHGKPNYTINRSTSNSPKNKSSTKSDLVSATAVPGLTYQLKSAASSTSSIASSSSGLISPTPIVQSSTNQIEKVILKHIESATSVNQQNLINSNSVNNVQRFLPVSSQPPMSSFISPGISSKAAATSFGVKLKQCNNKKNFENNGPNGLTMNGIKGNDEPEFVKLQRQIFEKLQHREQQELGHSKQNFHNPSDQQHLTNANEINNHEQNSVNYYVKNITNRLESSPNIQQQQNDRFKLPAGAICGKPVIPGKPAHLQTKLLSHQHQQFNLGKSQGNLSNGCNETNNKNDEGNSSDNLNGGAVNFEQKTVIPFSKDLSTEPNRYADMVKITKTVYYNEDEIDHGAVDDDDGLKEFIEHENSVKLAEDVGKLKFDIKANQDDVNVTSVLTR